MIKPDALEKALCSTFCSSISVNTVPCGYAVSTAFKDKSGDRLGFYIIKNEDGYNIEDSGDYLARLIASGIDVENGTRKTLLDGILQSGHAYVDVDTFEIKTTSFSEDQLAERITNFISSLIRVRDLELLTRDVVRSTFKEDAMSAIRRRFSDIANFDENAPVIPQFSDFPSELNIRPKAGGRTAAVFFATHSGKLDEAVMLKQEARLAHKSDFSIIAMIETADLQGLSRRKYQRAQNRSIIMPIFRGDEDASLNLISETLGLTANG